MVEQGTGELPAAVLGVLGQGTPGQLERLAGGEAEDEVFVSALPGLQLGIKREDALDHGAVILHHIRHEMGLPKHPAWRYGLPMTTDPRLALEQLTSALAEHLNAVASRRGEEDPRVDEAYEQVAESYQAYEDVLWDAYGEALPLDLFTEEDGEDEDEDDDEAEEEAEGDAAEEADLA